VPCYTRSSISDEATFPVTGLPKALTWRRVDVVGVEQTLLTDASGLYGRGTQICADPVPYTCRFEATAEGPGFVRALRLERASGRWRVTASEQGDLDAALAVAGYEPASRPGNEEPGTLAGALDIDLANSPLTNTLPIRRLRLLDAEPGTAYEVEMAFVELPSLEVVHSVQSYTPTDGPVVRFRSGSFRADITIDEEGYVVRYPGLADRA
jgi:hypothetical protein